jgi:branched-chain amino acid transport system substrate-binding protein
MNERDQYAALGDPVKIGVLMDLPSEQFSQYAYRVYDLVREQAEASGRFERGFEFVKREPYGPPAGSIHNTMMAFHELCDEGCVAVIGPNHSDSNIAIKSEADRRKVPVVALGATAQHMSDWVFSVCWSSIPHDAYAIASWLKQNGHMRVTVTWDRADHGLEYMTHFRPATARAGIKILGDVRFPQVPTPNLDQLFAETLDEHRALEPDAIVHFGTSGTATPWAAFVTASGWKIPRIMNDCFFGATRPENAEAFEGWVGTTMWDDDNEVMSRFVSDYRARYPDHEPGGYEMLALYRDGLTALMEGIFLAPILTPDGVRRGLEMVQLLPCASGGPRTCISFSPHAHRGTQGPDVMVLRRMRQGKLVMEGRIELF